MHETSSLYKQLFSGNHRVETRVAIGDIGSLITERGDYIYFGSGENATRILVSRSGADAGYGENLLMSVTTTRQVFAEDKPQVGCCVSGELKLTMIKPSGEIPRMAQIVPYIRLTDGKQYSEWIQKGVFYVDTRSVNNDNSGLEILTLHAYDAMLKAEQDYIGQNLSWPSTDKAVVQDIARLMDVQVEYDTLAKLDKSYAVQLPVNYTCREVLGYISAMYCGNFIMNDNGELQLIQLFGLPRETRYLIDHTGYVITFGGDRIRV